MAKKVYEEKNIRAIANKIREKIGGDTTYKTSQMPEGVESVYEAGQKAEYDRFWDNYLGGAYGNDGSNRFAGYGWNNETFKPNRNLDYVTWYMTFRSSLIRGDLVEILDKLGITLSTANATSLQYAFSATQFTRLGDIDCQNCIALNQTFNGSTKLETIDNLILRDDGTNTFNTAFTNCPALKNITIEGVIGNNIDFKSCPLLTHESLMSIINALKDFGATETFANVDYRWDGNYPYEYNPKNDFVYNVKSASFSSGELQLFLETDTDLDLVLVANDINYSGDLSKIKTAMISSDGTLTLTFEPTTTKTLTIGSTNLEKLTDAEKKIATDKGWTLA